MQNRLKFLDKTRIGTTLILSQNNNFLNFFSFAQKNTDFVVAKNGKNCIHTFQQKRHFCPKPKASEQKTYFIKNLNISSTFSSFQ